MAAVVECENLIKIHKQGSLEVIGLQGLDFTMEQGEFVAVVGPSGAGKSSLLQILAGMDQPSAGRVSVAETELSDISSPDLLKHFRRNVGFVWQDYTRNLVPYLSVLGNVELPMVLGGVRRGNRKLRARELLEVTGLDHRTYGRIHRLSGGEQQRLALCVALSTRPQVLLADEPTGELDTERSLEVYDLLRSLCHDSGLSVLVVTHDVALATRADRTVRLEDGRLMTERLRHGEVDRLAVDQRGRIQIPQTLLDQAGIADRAEAEATPDGIILRRPPDGS